MSKKKIGLFGGTFNPIHLGHLNLAMEMLEKCPLDEVWLCPAQISPYKLDEPPITAFHRLAMLKLAISGMPGLSICPIELYRPAPSYTIDTLEILLDNAKKCGIEVQFSLILGEDAASDFSRWHRASDIAALVPLLVGCRTATEPSRYSSKELFSFIKTNIFDISSTEVRQRLAAGKSCNHLIREKVLVYIHANRLYY